DADGSARLAACNPHDNAGAVCSRCGRKSFLVRKLYDNRHWDKTRYSTVELAVYSEAAKNPDAQGCCLTYVTEGEAIDLTDNLDGDGEHAKLDGVHDIEQANHFMVPFNERGWAYLKADLQENGAIRVTGEFGPYNPSYEAEAPNGKDRRMTLSTDGLFEGQAFYVIERSPGDYDPTGYVYVGDDAEADPRVDSSAMTTTWKLDQAVMDGTDPVPENEPNHVPATVEAGALYLTGTTTGEGTTVFVVNSFDMNKVFPDYFQFLEVTASVPWDGRVSFFFHPGDPASQRPVWNPPFLSIVATDTATGSNYVSTASALSAESPERLNAALHAATDDDTLYAPFTVTWDMSALVPDDFSTTGMVFTVDYLALPEYCVIDLTGGTNGASPAVFYLDAPPEGGWTDRYKTELLPMRLVPPETDGARPFYCALFETTQKQWELVTGGAPSAFPGATRPVEQVSWNDIRGDAETCDWPAADAVDEDSFVGILRRRTGLSALDLPTEAQWEFACRGWRTTDYSYGQTPNGDGMWFRDNAGGETHEAGTRTTNFFGLHDMHGNVAEWCLDRASSTGPERVLRGGGWSDYAPACTSSSRSGRDPSTGDGHCGFRLVRNLPLDSESERNPEAAPGGLRVGTVPTQDEEDPTIVSYSCASEAIALSRVVPHTVIFTWHGGSFETNYPHGTALRVPETPAPYTEGGTNYGFTGWSPEVAAVVTNDATYTAQYAVVPDLAVSCVVDAFGGGGESAIFTVAGPADSNGTADVAVYADETGGGDPVWSTNGVELAAASGGVAEFTVSSGSGVAAGQYVFATYRPNGQYAGATVSNRVMGTSSISLTTESNYQVDDNLVLGLEAYKSTGDIAVTLWVSDGNGGLIEFDWECAVVENTVEVGELPAGEYVVTAVLAGDANYLGSTDTKSFR
ncbi:MAG: formylglycine-generating enzyme family protein, partial [Kiritimatiellae bacterium]|nr:formylglycine-generating enzyme family protein [Kiritimatiellia bacterium]